MGKNLVTTTTVRLSDKDILRKLDVIAERNCRTRNRQVEYILQEFVDEFEKENGKIIITPIDNA